jgi:hypothetical protein
MLNNCSGRFWEEFEHFHCKKISVTKLQVGERVICECHYAYKHCTTMTTKLVKMMKQYLIL